MAWRAWSGALCVALVSLASVVGAQASCPSEHVVLVSIDGLPGPLLADRVATAPELYPTFVRLVAEGASTFNARTDVTFTNTAPNHVSMVTGRPVQKPPAFPDTVHHGYETNAPPGPDDTLHSLGNPNLAYIASVFDVVHDHGLSTGLFVSKAKLAILRQSYDAAHGAPDELGEDDGTEKIDRYVLDSSESQIGTCSAPLVASFVTLAPTEAWAFAFVHLGDPDSTGHAYGWGGMEWDAALHEVDGYLAQILDVLEHDPGFAGTTTLLVTADHGGSGTSHLDIQNPDHYTIPLLAWGAGVEPGADLYALNATTRTDPGTAKPGYAAASQPIRSSDAANLCLDLLGLEPVPGSFVNAAQDLRLRAAAAVTAYGCGTNPAGSLVVVSGAPSLGASFVLGLDDPVGTLGAGSLSLLVLAGEPDPAYPCGTPWPKGGLAALDADGELLLDLGTAAPVLLGPPWSPGVPATFQLAVPAQCQLVGRVLWAQGALVDPNAPGGAKVGLTEGARIAIGA